MPTKGGNLVQLQDSIFAIQAKFRWSGLSCSDCKIMAATTQALMMENQAAITNAQMQGRMAGTRVTFKLLISTARDMYEMQTLAKESLEEQKKSREIGLTTTNNKKKWFKCGKTRHVQKDWKSKDKENNVNNNLSRGNDATCYLCGQKGHKMASCWENHENSSKHPQGYKPQVLLYEANKKLCEAQSKNKTAQSNN